MEKYTLAPRLPTLAAYRTLCEALGMGRSVGDGAIAFYLQAIGVALEYQNRSIGTCNLQALFDYLKNEAMLMAEMA